ncbi:MAG: ABC transporter ATP-binding protein [Erysipelotrichaceae bacterium]|nr:ABC transporter ATP-binding protein [Erysipelotrichaceae bacterium]
MNTKDLVIVQNLTKRFDEKSLALDNVSFTVREGEFLSILGPSGCGKTTIMRILIGLLEPTSGTIMMEGRDITYADSADRNMGIVFQNYALFENMTVLDNVKYALKIKKETRNVAEERAMEMIRRMDLTEHANKKPGELSGGQQQRVAIARTLVLNPKIILFDEPMSALDVATRLQLRGELKKIQAEYGTTMVYVTHDQEEAFSLSDRIMVMSEANVVQLDTPTNIIRHPANDYIREFVIENLKIKINSLARYTKEINNEAE